jgi:hypothetical protein
MTVKELIKELEKFNPETIVLGEFDMDGDQFMVKVDVEEVYEGNGLDDSSDYDEELENTKFCIIRLDS